MRIHLATAMAVGGLLLATSAMAEVTGVTGGGAPISNYQPSLVLTQAVSMFGAYPRHDCSSCSAISTTGMIHTFAGDFSPWFEPRAEGELLAISEYDTLFNLFGTTYGGDGLVTFGAPDLAGRTAMGTGQGLGLTNRILGQQLGAGTNVMTLGQMPSHDHDLPGGGVTGLTGGNQPLNNIQPSLALSYQIAVSGHYPGGGYDPFLGKVDLFAGDFATDGHMLAKGQTLSISAYAALFSVLGTTYGGDGITTFRLPDLQGRVVVGAGGGVSLGDYFGTEDTLLTESNLPSHLHTLPGGDVTDLDGGGLPFNNLQPSLGLNYLIALNGIIPGSPEFIGWSSFESTIGEIIAFAGNYAPTQYAFANGQLLLIRDNTALFSLIGTTYGGDGRTTFALPDLRGRTILGAGDGFSVGQVYGENSHTLSINELAPHLHTLPGSVSGAVPEPATWALMISGFGMVGAMLRLRRVLPV